MLKWLKRLIVGCDHDFAIINSAATRNIGGYLYHQEPKKIFFCKKCGKKKETWG